MAETRERVLNYLPVGRVLGAMAKGLGYRAIADLLFLSPTTVRSYVIAL